MSTVVERVVDVRCEVGENPRWHPDEERLYWVDIPKGRLHWYDPDSDDAGTAYEHDDEAIGGFTVQTDGTLLLFQERGTVRKLNPSDGHVETVVSADPERFRTRFNDVIADPAGRVFAGTMPDDEREVPGQLHRLDRDGTFTTVVEECFLPNGMGFARDRDTFYFTDSAESVPGTDGRIYRYDYDETTGSIGDREIFVEIPASDGVPDGLSVDSEDHVWSARWNGHHVYRFDPEGTCVAAIEFPPRKVSSVAFGGSDFDELYATTACLETRNVEGRGAGSLYRADPGVTGGEAFRSRVRV